MLKLSVRSAVCGLKAEMSSSQSVELMQMTNSPIRAGNAMYFLMAAPVLEAAAKKRVPRSTFAWTIAFLMPSSFLIKPTDIDTMSAFFSTAQRIA